MSKIEPISEIISPGQRFVKLSEGVFPLPATIIFDLTINGNNDEVLPWFAADDGTAVSWYLSSHRDDNTIRNGDGWETKGKLERFGKIIGKVGQKYRMECTITTTRTVYFIDGQKYASMEYDDGTLGMKGTFGFNAHFVKEAFNVDNLSIFKYNR